MKNLKVRCFCILKRKCLKVFIIFSLLIFFLAAFFYACAKKPAQPPQKPTAPVTEGTVIKKTVPVQIRAIGNSEAYSTVAIKSQIGGELIQVHFREGQYVKKGDILFTIDPRPYEIALKQAEANLTKVSAQLENARKELVRYRDLDKEGFVSKEQYDQIKTNAAVLEAMVSFDKAVAENAKLQLKYCYIYSPVSGRAGNLISNQGNLIKANADNPMIIINQVKPIYIIFSVPEQYLSDIKKFMAKGNIEVRAKLSAEDKKEEKGVLTFIDNTVDTTTGTIKLKATFANDKEILWPGQFADVVLTLTSQPDAIVVPSQSIQTGQKGHYVFIIKDDLTVESRPVTVGITLNDESVVEKGLLPGEKIVTDGQLRLMPGAKVKIINSSGSK